MGRAPSGTCAPPFDWYSARLTTKDSQLSSSSPCGFHDTSASCTVAGQCQAMVAWSANAVGTRLVTGSMMATGLDWPTATPVPPSDSGVR